MKHNFCLQFILFLLVALCGANVIYAQDYRYKGEFYGNVGGNLMNDDETNLGKGLVVGGGIGYRFHRRWGVSFDVARNAHHRDFGTNLLADGHAVLVGGSAQFFFRPETNAQPYLRLGVNYARYRGTYTVKAFTPPFGQPVPGSIKTGAQNFFGPDFGFGVRFFATKRLSIRPEVRFAAHSGTHEYNYARDILEPGLWIGSFTIGAGYHW